MQLQPHLSNDILESIPQVIQERTTIRHRATCHEFIPMEACGKSSAVASLIREPLPQYDPRVKPNMAIITTEHAAGTA